MGSYKEKNETKWTRHALSGENKRYKIDKLQPESVYDIQLKAENKYLASSGQQKKVQFKTLSIPKCTSLKLDSDRNLCIYLDGTNSVKNNDQDMMIQVLMNHMDVDDEKAEKQE